MATYTYRVRNRQGEILQDQMEGADTLAIVAELRQQGSS